MINILLFNNNSDLNIALRSACEGSGEVKVITPNPNLADIARKKFNEAHSNIETVTVSHFLKAELESLIDGKRLENFQGKSELNLLLGSLWKLGRPSSSYELFKRSFQMLTDFRSFSMNEEVLQTILEDYDEELSGAVFWFHKLMMEMDIIDEHRSYFLLSEILRAGDLPPLYKTGQTYIFWGFDFLTASQVDLLNAMSIRENIIVPFYKHAYEKSVDLDWIKWLSRVDAKVSDTEELPKLENIELVSFSKNYLSKTLKAINFDFRFKGKKINYVFGTKNLLPEFVGELPMSDISFKVPIDLYSDKLGEIHDLLFQNFKKSDSLTIESVSSELKKLSKQAITNQDYRLYKLLSLTLEQVLKWNSLSVNNETLLEFDLLIIMDSVKLNVPRNSIFSSSSNGLEIKSLNNIDKPSEADCHILCITSEYGPVKGSTIQYSENVEKYLASIGPIRRSELEFLQLKSKIHEFLNKKETYILIEDGILDHDLGWSNIILEEARSFLDIQSLEAPNRRYLINSYNETEPLRSISATKLQSYTDCPRKYYFRYIDKKSPRMHIPGQLSFMELGLIEHKIIEDYLKVNNTYKKESLIELIFETLKNFQKEHHFKDEFFEEYQLEIVAFCTNIIKELLVLNKEIGLELKCEVELPSSEELKILGSIDCLGKNSDTLVILDFKRGGASIPSKVSLKYFKKIQLWFYLERMKKNKLFHSDMKLIWGYINLSSLDESLVFCNDEVLIERLSSLELKAFKKMHHFNKEYSELLEGYALFEAKIVEELRGEKIYACNPIDSTACTYCDFSNICPKGVS